jgi:hypothetical protein
MSKFRIKLKLQGLELEVEGTKENLPDLRTALTQQLAGVIEPATGLIQEAQPTPTIINNDSASHAEVGKRRRRSRSNSKPTGEESIESAVDWKHDSSKYGSPLQSWNTVDKAMWLLYVVGKETERTELSGNCISLTFKKHFKQAGSITTSNINRDLGRAKASKSGQPPLVSEDTTKNPPLWYLTTAGSAAAQKLVQKALGNQAEGA